MDFGLCNIDKESTCYISEASAEREDPQKFLYVVKGPVSAKDKKVFYVYGRGLDAKDGQLTKPMATKAMGQDPTWPQRQNPNDVYYNLTFIRQGIILLFKIGGFLPHVIFVFLQNCWMHLAYDLKLKKFWLNFKNLIYKHIL